MIGNSFSPLLGAVGGAGGGIPSMTTTTSSETGDLGVGANFGAVLKGDMNLNSSSSSWKRYIVAGGLAVAFVVILATLKKKGVI